MSSVTISPAIDHIGHIGVEECIRFAKRMEKYNIAWLLIYHGNIHSNMSDWLTVLVFLLRREDIFEGKLEPLIKSGGISVVHGLLTAEASGSEKLAEFAYDNVYGYTHG